MLCGSLLAQPNAGAKVEYQVLKDLSAEWLYYDESENTLVPYIAGNDIATNIIHLKLDFRQFTNAYLVVHAPVPLSLFANGQLLRSSSADSSAFILPIDSLKRHQGQLHLTVYQPQSQVDDLVLYVGRRGAVVERVSEASPVFRRVGLFGTSSIIILFLVVFTFFALLLNAYPKDFREFFNVSSVFLSRLFDEDLYKSRFLTTSQLLFLLAHATMIAFIVMVFFQQTGTALPINFMHIGDTLLTWLLLSAAVFILIILKLVLISLISELFDFREVVNVYFFDFIKLSFFFYGLLFLLVVVMVLTGRPWPPHMAQLLYFLALGFSLLRFAVLYFKLISKVPVHYLHLFSYLCTTELLPVLLGAKFFQP
jgi:hypothetical protein